ncbi:MOSC domain-containing protein [Herbiconiux sp. KACC 21604]|uniref:MOSC domain-containing protein n=1 Tax=unclassified Herbiconiux TaxID=2618217 RepID=UPI0014923B3A|nr:MOSC domain-containing protein [Herbiconiux sp. SALV-R1]QJU53881.1 MOSC domain-containing protein [Herbiconiux sp. SALV-R1]WPO84894.1 MOSC domain-containing protein [Herbiconiux sp. KACC 21604]
MSGTDPMTFRLDVEIVHLLASPVHRYDGRPADGPAPLPEGAVESRERIEVRAGLGIVGDRFFGHGAHRRAAVTVMAAESLDEVRSGLGLDRPLDPALARRNIVIRGADIDALVGQPFELDSGDGPVRFQGHRAANPCAWMNVVLADGAHKALRRRGGVRCEPLGDGVLRLGPAVLTSLVPLEREPALFAAAE